MGSMLMVLHKFARRIYFLITYTILVAISYRHFFFSLWYLNHNFGKVKQIIHFANLDKIIITCLYQLWFILESYLIFKKIFSTITGIPFYQIRLSYSLPSSNKLKFKFFTLMFKTQYLALIQCCPFILYDAQPVVLCFSTINYLKFSGLPISSVISLILFSWPTITSPLNLSLKLQICLSRKCFLKENLVALSHSQHFVHISFILSIVAIFVPKSKFSLISRHLFTAQHIFYT